MSIVNMSLVNMFSFLFPTFDDKAMLPRIFKKHPDFAGSTRPLKQLVPMAQGRALVVGGGVAGLATAAQLAREGMEVGGFAAKKWGILPANMGI